MNTERCYVCGGAMRPAFSKRFDWAGLGQVHYDRCETCGFVLSRTHARMSDAEWTHLNAHFHLDRTPNSGRVSPGTRSDRVQGNVQAIEAAVQAGAIPTGGTWLDYGCGPGHLTDLLDSRTGHETLRYEPFFPKSDPLWVDAKGLARGSCDLVISAAMLEHVIGRDTLDHIASLVSDDGALALYTVIRETIPDDPTWDYLFPVHCAFFTNAAMRALCQQWGFQSSAWYAPGRTWLLFRKPADALPSALSKPPWTSGPGFVAAPEPTG